MRLGALRAALERSETQVERLTAEVAALRNREVDRAIEEFREALKDIHPGWPPVDMNDGNPPERFGCQ